MTEKFGKYKNLRGMHRLDFSDKNLEKIHPELLEKFDTIFALNVVEHIPNHEQALKNALKMLKKGAIFRGPPGPPPPLVKPD